MRCSCGGPRRSAGLGLDRVAAASLPFDPAVVERLSRLLSDLPDPVRLVDINADPISAVTESGIDTAGERFEFDAIVFATGFDAMTGTILRIDVRGRDGRQVPVVGDDAAHEDAHVHGVDRVIDKNDTTLRADAVRHHRPVSLHLSRTKNGVN